MPHRDLRRLHRIVNDGSTLQVRCDLLEHLQHFSTHGEFSICKTGRIAIGPREAGDKAAPDGIDDLHEHDRDSSSHALDRGQRKGALRQDHIRLRCGEFRRVAAYMIEISGAPTYIDSKPGPVLPAKLVEPVQECRNVALPLPIILGETHQNANPQAAPGLLRNRRDRPSGRAAEQRDELAAPHHSITSSARASNVGGTSRPSALAVLRLMTSSYLVGACTGRSPGFSPL